MACNLFWALNISENMMKIMCLCANPEWGQKEIHGSSCWAIIRHSDRKNVLLGSGHFQAYPSCNKRKEKPHLPWDAHGVQPDTWSPTFTFLLVHSPVLPTLFLVRRDHSIHLKILHLTVLYYVPSMCQNSYKWRYKSLEMTFQFSRGLQSRTCIRKSLNSAQGGQG